MHYGNYTTTIKPLSVKMDEEELFISAMLLSLKLAAEREFTNAIKLSCPPEPSTFRPTRMPYGAYANIPFTYIPTC
jgi:hypothetical protein